MTRYLLSVASVHEAAAACDYLGDRTGPDDAMAVIPPDGDRDRDDALNVLRVRLPAVRVDVVGEGDDRATAISNGARASDAEVVVCGRDSGEATVGDDTVLDRVLDGADRPVVVLPSG